MGVEQLPYDGPPSPSNQPLFRATGSEAHRTNREVANSPCHSPWVAAVEPKRAPSDVGMRSLVRFYIAREIFAVTKKAWNNFRTMGLRARRINPCFTRRARRPIVQIGKLSPNVSEGENLIQKETKLFKPDFLQLLRRRSCLRGIKSLCLNCLPYLSQAGVSDAIVSTIVRFLLFLHCITVDGPNGGCRARSGGNAY